MGKIKVSFKPITADYRNKKERKKPYPTCKACGARLTDEKSIKRGYGHKCFQRFPGMIILEIVPEQP